MGGHSAVSPEESFLDSLRHVRQELGEFLAGKRESCTVLLRLYSAAPGRSSFLAAQSEAVTQVLNPPKSGKSLQGELSSICTLAARELKSCLAARQGPSTPALENPVGCGGGSRNEPREDPRHSLPEVAFVCICVAEFWLQFVQQVLAVKNAVDSRFAEDAFDVHEIPYSMGNFLTPLAAVARGKAWKTTIRQAAVDALAQLAWTASFALSLEGSHLGEDGESRGVVASAFGVKGVSALRRTFRGAVEALLEAPGDAVDCSYSEALAGRAVEAVHTLLTRTSLSLKTLRIIFASSLDLLLSGARRACLSRDELTAALGRSILCRLTWMLRESQTRSLPGDSSQQEESRRRKELNNRCLFSKLLNEAHLNLQELIHALDEDSAVDDVGSFSKGPEMYLIIRSLQEMQDLLLFGSGMQLPSGGVAAPCVSVLQGQGGRFVALDVSRLVGTLASLCRKLEAALDSASESWEDWLESSSAVKTLEREALFFQKCQRLHERRSEDFRRQMLLHSLSAKRPAESEPPRRGGKGSRKRQRKLQQQQQQQQQVAQQQKQNKFGGPESQTMAVSLCTSDSSAHSTSDESQDEFPGRAEKSDISGGASFRQKIGETSQGNSVSDWDQKFKSLLSDVQEAELSASVAATFESAILLARVIVEIAGQGGVISTLHNFIEILDSVFCSASPARWLAFISRLGRPVVAFVRTLLRVCPGVAPLVAEKCFAKLMPAVAELLKLPRSQQGGSWRRVALLCGVVFLAEERGISQAQVAAGGNKMQEHSKRGSLRDGAASSSANLFSQNELKSQGILSVSADATLWEGEDALSVEGSVVLLRGWHSVCDLVAEVLSTPACSSCTASTARLHAWVDAIVLGAFAAGLQWNPGKDGAPPFSCFLISDATALVATLRLLQVSLSRGTPPHSTLQTASIVGKLLRDRISSALTLGSFSDSLVAEEEAYLIGGSFHQDVPRSSPSTLANTEVISALDQLDATIRTAASTCLGSGLQMVHLESSGIPTSAGRIFLKAKGLRELHESRQHVYNAFFAQTKAVDCVSNGVQFAHDDEMGGDAQSRREQYEEIEGAIMESRQGATVYTDSGEMSNADSHTAPQHAGTSFKTLVTDATELTDSQQSTVRSAKAVLDIDDEEFVQDAVLQKQAPTRATPVRKSALDVEEVVETKQCPSHIQESRPLASEGSCAVDIGQTSGNSSCPSRVAMAARQRMREAAEDSDEALDEL